MSVEMFISYSHADEVLLDRLRKHLVMLQRDGTLNTWTDHSILPGVNLSQDIIFALDRSKIFLALISPDYLSSYYCYEKELQYASRRAAEGKMHIIPIILEPCEWRAPNSVFKDLLALPKDGQPISTWTNQNNAFLNVVTGIRRVLEAPDMDKSSIPSKAMDTPQTTHRRFRIKQEFDAIQKAEFAEQAYDVIRNYFDASCKELSLAGDNLRAKFQPMDSASFTCTVVNRSRRNGGEAHITVRNSKGRRTFGDINYVYQPHHTENNTSNGSINVGADDYSLFLTMGMFSGFGDRDVKLSAEKAADLLWSNFVKQAGIEYE